MYFDLTNAIFYVNCRFAVTDFLFPSYSHAHGGSAGPSTSGMGIAGLNTLPRSGHTWTAASGSKPHSRFPHGTAAFLKEVHNSNLYNNSNAVVIPSLTEVPLLLE